MSERKPFLKLAAVSVLALAACQAVACRSGADAAAAKGGVEGVYEIDQDLSHGAIDRIMDKMFAEEWKRIAMTPDKAAREALSSKKESAHAELREQVMQYIILDNGKFQSTRNFPFEQILDGAWKRNGDIIAFSPTAIDGEPHGGLSSFNMLVRDGHLTTRDEGEAYSWIILSRCTRLDCEAKLQQIQEQPPNDKQAQTNDKQAQTQTMRDMRELGTAIYSWLSDQHASVNYNKPNKPVVVTDYSPSSATELEQRLVPKYTKAIPKVDGWGHPLDIRVKLGNPTGPHFFLIRSAGRDGKFEGDRYDEAPFTWDQFDTDLVLADGAFVRYPVRRAN